MFYYIYVLKNLKSSLLYIGITSDLKRRVVEHNSDKSTYTKNKGKWVIAYFEGYRSKKDAICRERMLKRHGSSCGHLKRRILNSLNES